MKYDLRRMILSQNIYGVDIMPMAVEVSRLRAWLALVLVSEYKRADKKHNFNIKALPNLDFKFMCANTLVGVPENKYIDIVAEMDLKLFEELTGKLFSKEIPDYAKSQLRRLRRENPPDDVLFDALQRLIEAARILNFQEKEIETEKMIIRTICSEGFN